MATNIDIGHMEAISGNMADPPPTASAFNFSTFTTKMPDFNELLQQVRQNIRPWTEFFNVQNFRTIVNLQRLSSRVVRNLAYFQINYVIISGILLLYCLITSPLLLLVVAGVLYGQYKIRQLSSVTNICGREVTQTQLQIGLGLAAIPVLYLFGMQSIMFWVIGASTFFVAIHAIFYNIDAIVTEDGDGFLTDTLTV